MPPIYAIVVSTKINIYVWFVSFELYYALKAEVWTASMPARWRVVRLNPNVSLARSDEVSEAQGNSVHDVGEDSKLKSAENMEYG